MPRFKLIVAYDGTNYHGFQKQNNALSIQEVLEKSIAAIIQQPVEVIGAGRTDTGVHARGQCCVFDAETSIPVYNLIKAINSKLPKDIVVKNMEVVSGDFHPRYGAKHKTYRYQILNSKIRDPFSYKYAYFYPYELDISLMREAAEYIVGEHDFKCFCSAGSSVNSTVRTVYDLQVTQQDDLITIEICGNGFLYNMVRIIAGTLIQVGSNKLPAEAVKNIIASKDRGLAGPTAPPEGLMMLKIDYD
ncbi:tRNA pseudouridine(38-40) synthase TruA [Cellulosilyticum sp. I15G10I2]|uniref:tRNA pseudouridine(38-40) synthase TruA n=1 Tax=Cellulosilyticum sp. I15G10I2 TaxID=1892843 RepID=UPI00085CDE41|nr:tRNA pseudouridine(38-40) synthase TruA [Cellulosilyticum sp. I15G10I2]